MTTPTLTDPPAQGTPEDAPLAQRLLGEAREFARFLLVAAPAYLAFTTVAFAAYHIPSESMVPALEVGDRVAVSKFAYGYSRESLPLNIGALLPSSNTRFLGQTPRRGDVIVFKHPLEDKVMIKRLIGLPGDEIAVRNGVLLVNGVEEQRSDGETLVRVAHGGALEQATRYRETLPDTKGAPVTHAIHEFSDSELLDDFGPYVVPAGNIFAMGDNRDNSLDSRWAGMGPVPMENLIGRAETVYFAMPRFGRQVGVEAPAPRLFRPLSPRG
ncbi:MAG: signal peptidase I [Hyphomonadaceae bacterium]|nr:MAG: signal peptidase I [Caulobacteraceae bacterium]MBT9447294.1 signal peptidase I [Hyphomonadaceae bacterium]TPW08295.1 MAG: signal peptidase I [Alphaproteobacteria bacterium]